MVNVVMNVFNGYNCWRDSLVVSRVSRCEALCFMFQDETHPLYRLSGIPGGTCSGPARGRLRGL